MISQSGMNLLEAGDKITLLVHDERQEFVVLPMCSVEAGGHWACSCGEGIMNNMGLSSHRGEGHEIVYVCHDHGPETAVDA